MPLAKRVCIKCVNRGIPDGAKYPWMVWLDLWEDGKAMCYSGKRTTMTMPTLPSVCGDPLRDCPYAAEHVVSQGDGQ